MCNCWVPSSTHRRGQSVPVDSNYRSTENYTACVFPLRFQGLPGLRQADLEWLHPGCCLCECPFPSNQNPCACSHSGTCLGQVTEAPLGFCQTLRWPCLAERPFCCCLALPSCPSGLGSSAQSLFPFQGFLQPPPHVTVPTQVTLSVLCLPTVLCVCLAHGSYCTLSCVYRAFYTCLLLHPFF